MQEFFSPYIVPTESHSMIGRTSQRPDLILPPQIPRFYFIVGDQDFDADFYQHIRIQYFFILTGGAQK